MAPRCAVTTRSGGNVKNVVAVAIANTANANAGLCSYVLTLFPSTFPAFTVNWGEGSRKYASRCYARIPYVVMSFRIVFYFMQVS
jgi:hypothetical protein